MKGKDKDMATMKCKRENAAVAHTGSLSVVVLAIVMAACAASAVSASGSSPGPGWRVAELNGAPGLYHDGKPVPART